MKKLKVLILIHPDFLPPADAHTFTKEDLEFKPWITEFSVLSIIKKMGHNVSILGVQSDLLKIRNSIEEFKPHIVFNLLEEFHHEVIFDQNVVSYLELLKIPYTGCNPRGLILCRDKGLSKKILFYHRVPVPKFTVFPKNRKKNISKKLQFPLIVKCLNEEASLGLSKASVVHSPEKLRQRIDYIHEHFFVDVIVEEFIEGDEYYVGVIGNYRIKALPVRRLFFSNSKTPLKEFYSNRAKFNIEYRKKHGISTENADLPKDLEQKIQKLAKRTYKILGLNGYARVDFRVTKDGKPYILEVNPNPDISQFDDFALSADKAGLKYKTLIQKILDLGQNWSPTTFISSE